MNYSDMLEHCEAVFTTIQVSSDEARHCEKITRDQANNRKWFNFRTGRITASRAKRVCRTDINKPSKSLIKDICYPVRKTFTSKQTKWGCDHEKDGKEGYVSIKRREHTNLEWEDSGLIINTKYPFMGASPDGKVSCDCCDTILVEIKCRIVREIPQSVMKFEDDGCRSSSR